MAEDLLPTAATGGFLALSFHVDFSIIALIGALVIFLARVCDVSLGTLRTIYTLRGRRLTAASIGLLEVTIFITAIGGVLVSIAGETIDVMRVAGYIFGYATGIYVGISIEGYIASGWTLVRVMTRQGADEIATRLREKGEAVTRLMGEGRDGPVPVLFIVCRRKHSPAVLQLVREVAPQAFVTIDPIAKAIGGTYVPYTGFRLIARK